MYDVIVQTKRDGYKNKKIGSVTRIYLAEISSQSIITKNINFNYLIFCFCIH
mgnify:CR=1 FL=1